MHVESCFEKVRDIFDDNLPCDVELAKCPALDEISRIVGLTWIGRENFFIANILWNLFEVMDL